MRTGKKYFKDGNPEVFRHFNDENWSNMTTKEKSRWTPYSEVNEAPIPEEVIQFNESRQEPCCKEDNKCKKLEDEIADLKAQLAQAPKVEDKIQQVAVPVEAVEQTEDEKRTVLFEECRRLGIKTTHNMKTETLEKKLKDANNSE